MRRCGDIVLYIHFGGLLGNAHAHGVVVGFSCAIFSIGVFIYHESDCSRRVRPDLVHHRLVSLH